MLKTNNCWYCQKEFSYDTKNLNSDIHFCCKEHKSIWLESKHNRTKGKRFDNIKITKDKCIVSNVKYPCIFIDGERHLYTHFFYSQINGININKLKKKTGLLLKRICSTKNCINPYHYVISSYKNEIKKLDVKGENNGRHKLDNISVLALRKNKFSTEDIIEMYKVHKNTIMRAKKKKSWKHI